MTRKIRRIASDTVFCCTQRTVDRQFLFKPEQEICEIVGASAGRAQSKYPVKIYWLDFNINHKHSGIAPLSNDQKDLQNFINFERLFHSLLAREINRLLDREGPIFSSRDRIDEAIDDDAAAQQLFYAVTNPSKDGLIDRVKNWKGLSSYNQLATGRVDRFSYINRTAWHKAGGARSKKSIHAFTEWTEVKLSPLPGWEDLPPKTRQENFRRQVREMETEFRKERELKGRRAMTRRAMEKVDHRDRPKKKAKYSRQPMYHASTIEAGKEFERGWREYLSEYYAAAGQFLSGNFNVEFPKGSIRPPIIQIC